MEPLVNPLAVRYTEHMTSVAQTDLVDVEALAEIVADHLTEPTYCLDTAGENFTRFRATISAGGYETGTVTVALTALDGQTFELTVRRTS